MNKFCVTLLGVFAVMLSSCTQEDCIAFSTETEKNVTSVMFNITVANNTKTRIGNSKVQEYDNQSSTVLDNKIPIGLMGINNATKQFILDNKPVYETNGTRVTDIVTEEDCSDLISIYAIYPYVKNIIHYKDGSYAISFTAEDLARGPLLSSPIYLQDSHKSKVVNIDFAHISNSIGFKVCDITEDEELQGHMKVRKIILHGMPTEGTFLVGDVCEWISKSNHSDLILFEGDERVGMGEDNAKWISNSFLSNNREDCNRFNVVPETLQKKHCIEVIFDVDEFDYDGTHYGSVQGKSQIIPLDGVIPNDTFEMGLRYSFVIGMNLNTVYRPIQFSAFVEDWEEALKGRIIDYDNL